MLNLKNNCSANFGKLSFSDNFKKEHAWLIGLLQHSKTETFKTFLNNPNNQLKDLV